MLTLFATVDIVNAVDCKGLDVPVTPGSSGKLLECVRFQTLHNYRAAR